MEQFESALSDLVGSVWEQTLGLPILEATDTHPAGLIRTVEGHVHVFGTFQGTVVLSCSVPAATQAATRMFATDDGETTLTPPDLRDTVGELTNIIAGSIKAAAFDDGCQLSLPIVVDGTDYSVKLRGAHVAVRRAFESGGEPIIVTVFRADEPPS